MPEIQSRQTPRIVALGVSAGGAEALRRLFKDISPSTGLIYLVLIHASVQVGRDITETLRRQIGLPVVLPTRPVPLQADTVYIVPTSYGLSVNSSTIELVLCESALPSTIDDLLRQILQATDGPLLGVILSGLGVDGAEAIRSLVCAGGMAFVQKAESAAFSGMIDAALSTGFVAGSFEPEAMVPTLRHASTLLNLKEHEDPSVVEEILGLLESQYGLRMNLWNPALVLQVARERAAALRIGMEELLRFLRADSDEISHFFSRISHLPLGGFFESESLWPSAICAAVREACVSLSDSPMRVWVPQCGDGAVAFSVAIVVLQELARLRSKRQLQLLATDVCAPALRVAESAIYSAHVLRQVPRSWGLGSFVRRPDHVSIAPTVRERVFFSMCHPFDALAPDKMDLIFSPHWLAALPEGRRLEAEAHLSARCDVKGVLIRR